jgi:hypothetical protein
MNASETIDSYVRPFVTVVLVAVYCYLAVIGKVSVEVFGGTVTMVVLFWFKSREDEKKDKQVLEAVKEAKR